MRLLTTSQIHFIVFRVEVCQELDFCSNQMRGRAVTSVFHVNLIWISMKNYVLASCFVQLEFRLKIHF
jgi:hypothetical protein